jgi:HD-GYP domain-containing protein (c-di-GMP phosphodiesterase class II)
MRLVAVSRLTDGACLGRDVHTGIPGQAPLLRRGSLYRVAYGESLHKRGIRAVYIDDALGEGIDVPEALTDYTRREAENALTRAFQAVPDAFASGRPMPEKAMGELRRIVQMIADEVADSGDAVLALADLASSDAYTLHHSIDVTVLGLLLGRRVLNLAGGTTDSRGRRLGTASVDDLLAKLGVGLLLHDIGKLAVPEAVLNKPGPLVEEEWDLIRQHPLAGLEMLPGDAVGPLAKSVIRSHHERWDGMGYPDGRADTEIPQFARIASVADVYDAVTSARPYREAAPANVGHAVIVAGAGTAFDPDVVDIFRRTVAPTPPGDEIIMPDGSRGIVVSVPEYDLEHPLVRVTHDRNGDPVEPFEITLDQDEQGDSAASDRRAA